MIELLRQRVREAIALDMFCWLIDPQRYPCQAGALVWRDRDGVLSVDQVARWSDTWEAEHRYGELDGHARWEHPGLGDLVWTP